MTIEPGKTIVGFIGLGVMGLDTPGLDLTLSLYEKMAEMGYENNGTQALFKLFE